MILKLFLYSLIFVSSLYANVSIDHNTSKISLLPYSSMYIDNSSQMTFAEIQHQTFKPINSDEIKLGYTQSTIWIQFKITNKLNQPFESNLIINKPILDTIDLFEKEGQTYRKTSRGILSLGQYEQNNILHPNFHINFKPYETRFFYLKIHSTTSSNNFKLHIKDTQTLYQDEITYQIMKTIFLGIMIGLIIYNLFLFFFIKESVYLYYVLYMFFLTTYYVTYTQIINYIIIFPQSSYVVYFIGIANIFVLMFIKTFLKVQNKVHTYIIYTIIILYLIFGLSITITSQLTILNMLFVLYLCTYALYKKNDQVKYIFLGWLLMVIGTIMQILKAFGLWTLIDYFPHFYEFTILSEAILFSVALAARLNKNTQS